MGKSKSQTVGYKYYLGMHMILCHGPIDNITRIQVDETDIWTGTTTGGSITVAADDAFGGDTREGGISGTVDIAMGAPAQAANTYLQTVLGILMPAYRGVVGVILRQCYLGNNPYLKGWSFRGQRIHLTTGGATQWFDETAEIEEVVWRADFSQYADTAAMLAEWTEVDVNGNVDVTLQDLGIVHGRPGRKGPRALNTGGAANCQLEYTITGLTPGQTYYLRFDLYFIGSGFIPAGEWVTNYTPTVLVADSNGEVVTNGIGIIGSAGGSFTYDNIRLTTGGHKDMNPIHVVRECLTDRDWGMGYPDTDIGTSFEAAALTVWTEGLGVSLLWDRSITIEEFVKLVLRHADAALYVSRTTGKFEIKLIRNDYDPDALLILDESNISKLGNPKRPTFGELSNSVTVTYWDPAQGKDATITVTDTAMVQMQGQGQVIGTPLQYNGITNARSASRLAQRDLRALSASYLSCTVYTNQVAKDLNIGDVFKLSWDRWQLSERIMRVSDISFGDGKNNQIRINCTEDVFSTPLNAVTVVRSSPWVNPSLPPAALTNQMADELPYYEAVTSFGQSAVDSALLAVAEAGYVMAAAAKPSSAINAEMWTDGATGGVYQEVGQLNFAPHGLLSADIAAMDTSFVLTGATRLNQVVVGTHVQINIGQTDSELCRVDAVDTGTNTITVGRGLFDTPPKPHAAGSPVFFWDRFYQLDPTEYVETETVQVKLTTISGRGALSVASAVAMPVGMAGRAARPYAPGQYKIDAVDYPAGPLSGALAITWASRNRKLQTGAVYRDHTFGAITAEAGSTYRLRAYTDGVLTQTDEPVTSGFSWTGVAEGVVRLELDTLRDGLYSWQPARHEFIYSNSDIMGFEADTDFHSTLDGDYRATED